MTFESFHTTMLIDSFNIVTLSSVKNNITVVSSSQVCCLPHHHTNIEKNTKEQPIRYLSSMSSIMDPDIKPTSFSFLPCSEEQMYIECMAHY